MDDMINNGMGMPKWMTTVDNCQPISFLPLMWKLMTVEYLKIYNLLPVEQKGCRKNCRGTKEQLLIDKMVLNDCKKKHTNLGMVWTNYMIPHS